MKARNGGLRGIPSALGLLLLVVLALCQAGIPSPAGAAHDLGSECYACHDLRSGQVWAGSYAIWSGKPIGMNPYSRAITCDVCHTNYGGKFRNDGTNKSWHPVRIISGAQTLPDNTIVDYGSSPDYLDCGQCHYGNQTAATPNLNPDVAPYNFASPQTDNSIDGYPNHDNTIAGYNIAAASWSGQNVVTAGTQPHLGLVYNPVPSADNAAAAANYALCFTCHDGSAGKTNRRVDVKGQYLLGAGHYYKGTGNRMPCSDCHLSHNSPSSRLYAKPANARTPGAVVYTNPAAPTAADIRNLCTDCHDDYNVSNTGNGNPLIRGIEPAVRTYGVGGHAPADTENCTICHDPHDAPATCNTCHGEAALGSGAPPFAPGSGNRVWPSTVDNYSLLSGLGNHRSRPASGVNASGHDPFTSTTSGCTQCHTSTPGSGATHNQAANDNAVMTNIANHTWTGAGGPLAASWSGGALAGAVAGGSVVDDSCSNIDCHSPYYNANAYRSGTPFPYRRYWINSTLWDCYTCHAYDGLAATSRPGGADNSVIGTGSHGIHLGRQGSLPLLATWNCSACHVNNEGNNAHKDGLVQLPLSGAVGPLALGGSYATTPALPQPPTDNGAGHRAYGTCSNVYCHSAVQKNDPDGLPNDNVTYVATPAWGGTGVVCGSCHKVGFNVKSSGTDNIASGSHTAHTDVATRMGGVMACLACHWYSDQTSACSGCHTSHIGEKRSARHVDGYIDVGFSGTMGAVTLTGLFDANGDHAQDNTIVPGMPYGSCESLYCHGTGTPLRTGGANRATGTTNIPKWGDPATSRCGSCHGAPGATGNYNPATYAGTQNWPSSGAHGRHFADASGPQLPATAAGCGNCHRASTDNTHVNGAVDFKRSYTDNSAVTLAATQICNPCHGSGSADAKANWSSVSALDCLTCHGSTRATTNYDNTGRVAPNVGGDNSTYGAAVRGHNRPAALGPYPFTGNPAANRSCADCHDLSIDHIDGTDNATYAGNRLTSAPNGKTGVGTVAVLCEACHKDPTGPVQPSKRKINRHGNANYAGRLEAVFADRACDQCHEPHGMVSVAAAPAGVNLWMINPAITVASGVTVSPVRLYAKTGANSFNNYDPGAGNELDNVSYLGGGPDQLCVVCHARVANPGFPMTRNIAGRHNAPNYTGNEAGKDCSGCHSHNQDDNTATVDGLMPLACNACHSYPGVAGGTYTKAMSAVHAKHVGTPAGTANSREYECTVCHYNYNHNQCRVVSGGAWPPTYYDNVNVDFDPAINPVNARGPKYRTVNTPTTGNGAADGSSCDGIYCHGNSASQTGWGGTTVASPPQWDNVPAAACGSCHNASAAMPQGNHPVHLSETYGPLRTQFTDSGTCSEGTGCHTPYGFSPTTPHANGQPSFRTSTSDNTPVGLGATGICRNCHSMFPSSQGTGDTLARTQANWDNGSYRLPCVTCHNDAAGASTPPASQGRQNLDGTGNRAPNIDNQYYGTGHGKAGIASACSACHGVSLGHIGALKVGTNPWRLSAPNLGVNGGLDNTCSTQCHGAGLPDDHSWRVTVGAPVSPESKETTDTHPTSTQVVGTNKDRWYQVPSDGNIPLQGNLTQDPHTKTSAENIVCVSCHDPHGIAATAIASRNFSGAHDNGWRMLRFKEKTPTSPTPLCTKCHK